MSDLTVLMTGAGAPGASGIIKSLRAMPERDVRIVGVDMNPDAYGFAFTDDRHVVPAGDAEEYVPRMQQIATNVDADVVLPLTTNELGPLANHRAQFDCPVLVSRRENLRIANNKARLYRFLESNGFDATPEYSRVETDDEFVDAVHELGYPDRPVCFKPPVASGMRGFRILDESTDRLDRLLETKPDVPITTLSEIRPVLRSAAEFPTLAVMEYLPGEEYSVDVLAMDEEVGPVVPRSRTRTRAGISFEGTVERKQPLIDAASSICRTLGLEYNVNLQFKDDRAGTPKLIEINPRVSGTIVMCLGAGVNLPALAIRYALGEAVPSPAIDWGTSMVRYWEELFHSPDGESFQLSGLQ